MTLTLTLSRLPSFDSPLEKLATAALTAPPIKNSASGVRAAPPTMLTTLPCEAFSSGQNRRVSRTQPKNFSAKPSSQTASGNSRNAPARVAPALLTSTSQRWKRSLTRWNNCSHASSLRRSPPRRSRRRGRSRDRLGGGNEILLGRGGQHGLRTL